MADREFSRLFNKLIEFRAGSKFRLKLNLDLRPQCELYTPNIISTYLYSQNSKNSKIVTIAILYLYNFSIICSANDITIVQKQDWPMKARSRLVKSFFSIAGITANYCRI